MTDRLKTHAPFALAIIALLCLIGTGCGLMDDYPGEDENTTVNVVGNDNTVSGGDLTRTEQAPLPTPIALPTVATVVAP